MGSQTLFFPETLMLSRRRRHKLHGKMSQRSISVQWSMAFLTLELQTVCQIKDVGPPRVGSVPQQGRTD